LAAEPALLKTWNTVPGATVATALVPLPTRRSKAVRVLAPVPPLATESWPCQPRVRVLLAMEPVTLVPLTTKPTRVVPRVEELVPPLATGRTPETWEVKATAALYRAPLAVDWTTPPALREVMVVEPLEPTLNWETPLLWRSKKLPVKLEAALIAK
jgi:hypothetical protein